MRLSWAEDEVLNIPRLMQTFSNSKAGEFDWPLAFEAEALLRKTNRPVPANRIHLPETV